MSLNFYFIYSVKNVFGRLVISIPETCQTTKEGARLVNFLKERKKGFSSYRRHCV